MSKLQKKPSALKRGHPTLQNMNFYKKFSSLWVIFALLDSDPDPDSESGSGSTGPIESGSNQALDPKPCKLQEKPSPLKIEQPALKKMKFFTFFRFLRLISSQCYFPSILSLQGGCLISSHKGQHETNKKKIRHVWWQNKN